MAISLSYPFSGYRHGDISPAVSTLTAPLCSEQAQAQWHARPAARSGRRVEMSKARPGPKPETRVSSLADAKSSLGDAKSSLGDAKSSLGDAKSSLG